MIRQLIARSRVFPASWLHAPLRVRIEKSPCCCVVRARHTLWKARACIVPRLDVAVDWFKPPWNSLFSTRIACCWEPPLILHKESSWKMSLRKRRGRTEVLPCTWRRDRSESAKANTLDGRCVFLTKALYKWNIFMNARSDLRWQGLCTVGGVIIDRTI